MEMAIKRLSERLWWLLLSEKRVCFTPEVKDRDGTSVHFQSWRRKKAAEPFNAFNTRASLYVIRNNFTARLLYVEELQRAAAPPAPPTEPHDLRGDSMFSVAFLFKQD